MLPSVLRKRAYDMPVFFNDLLDDFMPRVFTNTATKHCPAVNIEESEKEYKIEVAAPGFEKEDLKLSVNEGLLTISAEKRSEKEGSKDQFLRREFGYNSFTRSFSLPEETDAEKIVARHRNGVLQISIPKAEVKVSPSKDIKIS